MVRRGMPGPGMGGFGNGHGGEGTTELNMNLIKSFKKAEHKIQNERFSSSSENKIYNRKNPLAGTDLQLVKEFALYALQELCFDHGVDAATESQIKQMYWAMDSEIIEEPMFVEALDTLAKDSPDLVRRITCAVDNNGTLDRYPQKTETLYLLNKEFLLNNYKEIFLAMRKNYGNLVERIPRKLLK